MIMLVKIRDEFELNIKENAFDNMEALDCLSELADGNVLAVSKVCNLIMDKTEKKKLYDFLRDKNDGKVHVDAFSDALTEIMLSLGEKEKN